MIMMKMKKKKKKKRRPMRHATREVARLDDQVDELTGEIISRNKI